jgi:hypothetical protein
MKHPENRPHWKIETDAWIVIVAALTLMIFALLMARHM